jgi:Ricin-type beta-trefoil lectin domain-like
MKYIFFIFTLLIQATALHAQTSEAHLEEGLRQMEARGEIRREGNVIIVLTAAKSEIPFYSDMYKKMLSQTKDNPYTIAFLPKGTKLTNGRINPRDLVVVHDPTGNGIAEMLQDQEFFSTGKFALRAEWAYRYLYSEFFHETKPLSNVTLQPYYADVSRQYWSFNPQGNGYYKIKNGDGKCLQWFGADEKALLITTNDANSDAQLWKIIPTINDNYTIMSKTGRYLTIPNGGTGTNEQTKYNVFAGTVNEQNENYRWQLIKVAGNNYKKTNFNPEVNGFRFINSFAGEDFIRWGGLCGGMVYTALDYFIHNVTLPTQSWIPANGLPLQHHIWQRQQHSMWNVNDTWTMLNTGFEMRRPEFFWWGTQGYGGGRLEVLKNAIDANRSMPLGLFSGNAVSQPGGGENEILGNHVALAYGYNMGRYTGNHKGHQQDLQILLWDPNYGNIHRTLIPNIAGSCYFELESGVAWLTYFANGHHDNEHIPPPVPNFPEGEPNGSIKHLYATFTTGGDDLRAYSKVNITINYKDGTKETFENVNKGFRWADNSTNGVHLPLRRSIKKEDVESFTIHHGEVNVAMEILFGSNDNWNLDLFHISSGKGGVPFVYVAPAVSGQPYHRFTGINTNVTVPVNR